MPTRTRRFTDFAHARGADGLRAALRACIGPQNRQTTATVKAACMSNACTIIFSTCDRPMNALTRSMRDQIGAPGLLNDYMKWYVTTRTPREFEGAMRNRPLVALPTLDQAPRPARLPARFPSLCNNHSFAARAARTAGPGPCALYATQPCRLRAASSL